MNSIPRFNRNYELKVRALGGEITMLPPLRVNFSADKSIRGGLNKMQLQIYNLEERKRLTMVRDAEDRTVVPLQLKVGYQDTMELIFKGTIHRGSNARQGADIVTTIECLDGGFDFINSFTSRTVEGGRRAIDAALSDMPNTGTGKITDRPTLTRPKVLVGNSAKLISDTVGPDETWYIENEQLYIIKNDEVVSRFIPVVSAQTGLISTPERESQQVTFKTLMNPAVKIGQRCKLVSETAPHLNGVYRIETINYSGDNFGSDWTQTVTGTLAANVKVL